MLYLGASTAVSIRLYGTHVHFVAHPLFQERYSMTKATSSHLLDLANEMCSFGTIVCYWSLARPQRARCSQIHRHGLPTAHPNAIWMGTDGLWMGMDGRSEPIQAHPNSFSMGYRWAFSRFWMGVSSRWRSPQFRPCVRRLARPAGGTAWDPRQARPIHMQKPGIETMRPLPWVSAREQKPIQTILQLLV